MRVWNILKRYRGLLLVLVLGLAVRLWAMQWPPLSIDMKAWIAWGERMLAVGPRQFYSDGVFADYAPGYLYVLWLIAALKHALAPDASSAIYPVLYRLPPIVFDLATGTLIFGVVRDALRPRMDADGIVQPGRASLALPTFAAACHIFNPAIIFNSATWGQIDGIFTGLMLLALLLLLRGQAEWAVASYMAAFLIKPQAVSMAPVIGVFLLLRYPVRRWLTAALVGISLAFAIVLPFFGLRSFLGLYERLKQSVEVYPYTSMFTYNIWGLYGFWKDDTVRSSLGPTLRTIGTLLYGAGLIFGCGLFVRKLRQGGDDQQAVWWFATFFTFLPVMVLTRMHERYIYPVLPLLLICVFCSELHSTYRSVGRYLRSLPALAYGALTALHTLNLYEVYIYYLYFDTGVPRTNRLFYFIHDNYKLWSGITLLIFAGFTIRLTLWAIGQRRTSHYTQPRRATS